MTYTMKGESKMKQIVQVQPEEVLNKLKAGLKTFVFKTGDNTTEDLDTNTYGQIRSMINNESDAYLFFVIKDVSKN